ncbi:MAG: hypothetical protein ACKO3T_07210 [Planctomycetaceae bacterium]
MSDDKLQARIDRAESNWNSGAQGDPGTYTWGLFSYGDAPGAMGGGVGMFIWFPSRNDLLDFIASTLPYSPPGPTSLDCEAVASETAAIVENMKCGRLADPDGIAQLNKVLQHFSQITWAGTFTQLLTEPHPYAQEVRAAFRMEDRDIWSDDAITEAEEPAFRGFLNMWGI